MNYDTISGPKDSYILCTIKMAYSAVLDILISDNFIQIRPDVSIDRPVSCLRAHFVYEAGENRRHFVLQAE